LIEPTSGRVIWNGIDITALPRDELRQIRRQMGMIFQQFNLVKRSSVMTNVLSGRLGYVNPWRSAVGRWPKKDVQKALGALETVGILDQAKKRADELSGGQQQRVGIARALVQDPKLLLADEPVASLDPATSHSILKYLEQINRDQGVTVLCSLHFLSLARAYGTRLIALKDGEIVFEGLPAEIDDDKFRDIYGQEAIQVEIR
jgi:phosphonate transport system ATP-binding protein